MKNLLLIGDSIRMGYDKSVKRTLEGKANVIFPTDNCRFAAYLLRKFHEYLSDIKGEDIDVVHWNAGLWDCLRLFEEDPHTPIDVYAYYIERVCVRIKKICPNAKVIFATSTKVLSEKMGKDFKRYNEDIEKYNEVAVEIAKKQLTIYMLFPQHFRKKHIPTLFITILQSAQKPLQTGFFPLLLLHLV